MCWIVAGTLGHDCRISKSQGDSLASSLGLWASSEPSLPHRAPHPLTLISPVPACRAGTLAGSTVLLVSLAWGFSVILGRCDLSDRTGRAVDKKLTRGEGVGGACGLQVCTKTYTSVCTYSAQLCKALRRCTHNAHASTGGMCGIHLTTLGSFFSQCPWQALTWIRLVCRSKMMCARGPC